ncbi:hypothetical protein V8C37DRAFT_383343 [Trichoderma ceciliae]
MSLRDDDKPPSVTTGVMDDGADPETQPPSSSPKIHVLAQEEPIALGAKKLPKSASRIASRSPIEAVEEKLPDSHADEGSNRKPSRDDGKVTKPRWDPFARYFSDAHSFPDYGERNRSSTMGPERLKKINGSTKPVNTLNSRRYEAHNEADVPALKRQKKEITRTYGQTTSPFFPKPRPTKNSDIQEVLIESSQDDIYDIRSTSSAGNVGVTAVALNEYRHVLPSSSKGTRVRKSRASKSSSQSQRGAADAKSNVHRLPALQSSSRGLISIAPGSPDALAFEEFSSATADAGSDLSRHFTTKRDRPYRLADTSGPQIKRHKPSTVKEPIDISEDELQADCAKYTDSKSPTSRFSNSLGGHTKTPMRGDLHHTVFGKSMRQPRSDDIAITRAVCGKWAYDRDHHSSAILLRRQGKQGKRLEPVSLEDGQETKDYAWLGIDLDHVRAFGYSEAPSRYGYVMRSQSGDAGPKLYLEFESIESTRDFLEIIKSANIEQRVTEELEKKTEKAFNEAKKWMASNSTPKKGDRTYTNDRKEKDIVPASSSPDRRPGSASGKLKDSLIQSAQDLDHHVAAQRSEESLESGLRRSTRTSAPSTRRRMSSPEGWTELHPDWQISWLAPLVFPPTGKNRATVDKIDIPRLDEKEFLNDNLINFYIRYLEYKLERERPELLRKVYFFSTFFFEKLKSTKGKINYDGVKAWTAKVDLLSYDYIFVPVNEHAHWYLAIICNVPKAIQFAMEEQKAEASTTLVRNAIEVVDSPSSPGMSTVERELTDISLGDGAAASASASTVRRELDDLSSCHGIASSSVPPSPTRKRKSAGATPSKLDPTQPRIVTLDSLGGPHAPTCKALKEYLVEEARTKKGIALTTVPTGMTARGIPEQNNFCDCGVFVLGYMQEFLANPDEAARRLLLKEDLGWDIRPSELRNRVRGLLFDLQVEQQKQHEQLEKEKKLRKAKRKSMAETSTQNSSPPKPAAFSSPVPKVPGAFPSDFPEEDPLSDATLSSSEPAQSESVQEANDLEDNDDLNGKALQKEQQNSSAPEEPQFISSLSDGSITSPHITKDKTLPATSSPTPKHDGRFSRFVVELKSLKGRDKSEFEETAMVDDAASVPFVKELSSSSSEKDTSLKPTETSRSRHSSVELIGATKSRPTSSFRMQNQRAKSPTSVSPRFRVRRSIESDAGHDTRGEPKYDGIDRSANKTTL